MSKKSLVRSVQKGQARTVVNVCYVLKVRAECDCKAEKKKIGMEFKVKLNVVNTSANDDNGCKWTGNLKSSSMYNHLKDWRFMKVKIPQSRGKGNELLVARKVLRNPIDRSCSTEIGFNCSQGTLWSL